MIHRALLVCAALASSACVRPLTELVLVVGAEVDAPVQIASLRITVEGPGGFRREETTDLTGPGAVRSPWTLSLVHRGGAPGPFTVRVEGLEGNGAVVVGDTARTHFVEGETRALDLVLRTACIASGCTDGTVCGAQGACIDPERPVESLRAWPVVHTLAAGEYFGCARDLAGGVRCYGDGPGHPIEGGSNAPVRIDELEGALEIAAGPYHGCARFEQGRVRCWSRYETIASVTLGDNGTVSGLSADTSEMSLGAFHGCARSREGAVRCWGANAIGQLGTGSRESSASAVDVSLPAPALQIASGYEFTCALLESGAVHCWGEGRSGQLGHGSLDISSTPVLVSGLTDAVAIAAGRDHACARKRNGSVVCWGENTDGALGDGTTTSRSTPVAVRTSAGAPLTAVVELALGDGVSCARGANGTVQCWGANGSGQLGDGTFIVRSAAASVREGAGALEGAIALEAGAYHVCATMADRSVRCWGANDHGQLGLGTAGGRVNRAMRVDGL